MDKYDEAIVNRVCDVVLLGLVGLVLGFAIVTEVFAILSM